MPSPLPAQPSGARRLRLVLEYDGGRFCGFQRQPGQRSVQGELEAGLSALCGHPVATVGAGRTDAGVHALGQVVHFDTTGRIPVERIARALNTALAPELVVRHVEETETSFHARYHAVSRSYSYFIMRRQPSPFQARYTLYEPALREDAAPRIESAARPLLGRHDFQVFSTGGLHGRSPERTVLRAGVVAEGDLLRIDLTADSFLRSMVRVIVGLLLEVGRGRRSPESVRQVLRKQEELGAAT
ncbi:MAG TPA: tRNA pseudouridine(38-40) synthase TruA, partial [Armatimonadota bacterium]|nr:tRNA pseudouridine(38-40) synthase TruA [Armatimonadota bacterium]